MFSLSSGFLCVVTHIYISKRIGLRPASIFYFSPFLPAHRMYVRETVVVASCWRLLLVLVVLLRR